MRVCSFHPCRSRSRSETMEVSLAAYLIGLKMCSWAWGSAHAKMLLTMRSAPQSFSITHSWCASVWYFILFVGFFCMVSSASLSGCRMGLVWNTPAGFRKTGSWNEALEAVRSHRLCCQRGVRCAFCMNHCGEPYFRLAASAQLLSLRQRRQCRCAVVIGKWDYDHVTF